MMLMYDVSFYCCVYETMKCMIALVQLSLILHLHADLLYPAPVKEFLLSLRGRKSQQAVGISDGDNCAKITTIWPHSQFRTPYTSSSPSLNPLYIPHSVCAALNPYLQLLPPLPSFTPTAQHTDPHESIEKKTRSKC